MNYQKIYNSLPFAAPHLFIFFPAKIN